MMLDFIEAYWWVAPVTIGLTEWFVSLFPRLGGRPRDILLPAVALVVTVLSVYLPRIVPAHELMDLANTFVLWASVTGIVKWQRRLTSESPSIIVVDKGLDKSGTL